MAARAWIAAGASGALLVAGALGWSAKAAGGEGTEKAAVVELGRRLFFDPAVSRSGENSCASCHDPSHGWSSPRQRDDDDFTLTSRHSQTLVDAGLSSSAHWDGEFQTVEDLVTARLGVPSGLRGNPNRFAFVGLAPASPGGSSGGGGYGGGGGGSGSSTNPPPAAPPPPPSPTTAPPATPPAAPATTPKDDAGGTSEGKKDDSKDSKDSKDEKESKDGKESKDAKASSGAKPAGTPTAPSGDKPRLPPNVVAYRDDEGRRRTIDLTHLVPVAERVEEDGRYAEAFQAAFGSARVTTSRVSEAIGSFVRSIRSTESPFDRFHAGDEAALSPAAQRGLRLFRGKATCAQCHVLGHGHAALTDGRFHVTGVVARTFGGPAGLPDADRMKDKDSVDRGRGRFSEASTEERAFKTPTLRDVAKRGPYMHDGTLPSLEDVVRFYARGAVPDPSLDPVLKGFEVSDAEVRDLVAFLESLSGDVPPGLAPDFRERAKTTRVRILDASRRPIAGLAVRAVPAGDRLPGDVPMLSPERDLVTDADGAFEFVPPRRTHTRLLLPDGLRAPQGEWIPDSCAEHEIVLPVAGRVDLLLVLVRPEEVPSRLSITLPPQGEAALHRGAKAGAPPTVAAAMNARTVVFQREGTAPLGKVTLARYRAWVPEGAPAEGLLTIPSGTGRITKPVSLVAGRETRIDLRDP